MFCSTTLFEGVKQINESTVRKINKTEHIRNEDQKDRIYWESIRVTEKELRRNQVIHTAHMYRTTSSLLINSPQVQAKVYKRNYINNSAMDIRKENCNRY